MALDPAGSRTNRVYDQHIHAIHRDHTVHHCPSRLVGTSSQRGTTCKAGSTINRASCRWGGIVPRSKGRGQPGLLPRRHGVRCRTSRNSLDKSVQQRPVLHLDASELFRVLHVQNRVGRHPCNKWRSRFILEQPIDRRPPVQQYRVIFDVLRKRRPEVKRHLVLQLCLAGLPLRKR